MSFSIEISYEPGLTKTSLAKQLATSMNLPDRLAYGVAKDTLLRLRSSEFAIEEFGPALSASLDRVFSVAELALVQTVPRLNGGQGLLLQASTSNSPGGLAGPVVTGLVSGATSAIVSWLLSQNKGAVADGSSVVCETGGAWDDGFAPAIKGGKIDVALADPNGDTCCQTGLGGKGIKVTVDFETTDNTGPWYSNDSGVTSSELGVVMGSGENRAIKTLNRKDYTGQEEGSTEDGFFRESYSVCVPCKAVKEGVIYFVLTVRDDDGNYRTYVQPEAIGEQAAGCCMI